MLVIDDCGNSTFAARWLLELSTEDDLFFNPRSGEDNLKECSAVKYRSTDHIAPHPDQIDGSEKLGVPPLIWVRGQTLDNIQHMIDTAIVSLEHVVPEVAHAYYDFQAKTFCDSEGGQLLETVFGRWSDHLAGSRTASAGITTFKRGILLRSLVRQESSTRSCLLEQVLRDSRQFVEEGDLFGIFY